MESIWTFLQRVNLMEMIYAEVPEEIVSLTERVVRRFVRDHPPRYPWELHAEEGKLIEKWDEIIAMASNRVHKTIRQFKKGRPGYRGTLATTLKQGNLRVNAFIFTLPQHLTCSGRTKLCSRLCYAHKGYQRTPSTIAYRIALLTLTTLDDFPDLIITALEENKIKAKMNPDDFSWYPAVRIHESGDFYDEGYFKKWVDIAELALEHDDPDIRNILFQAYTKVAEVTHIERPENFVLAYSLWRDNFDDIDRIDLDNIDIMTYAIGPWDLVLAKEQGIIDIPLIYRRKRGRDIELTDVDRVMEFSEGLLVKIMEQLASKNFSAIRKVAKWIANEMGWEGTWTFCSKEIADLYKREDEEHKVKCMLNCDKCYIRRGKKLVFFLLH